MRHLQLKLSRANVAVHVLRNFFQHQALQQKSPYVLLLKAQGASEHALLRNEVIEVSSPATIPKICRSLTWWGRFLKSLQAPKDGLIVCTAVLAHVCSSPFNRALISMAECLCFEKGFVRPYWQENIEDRYFYAQWLKPP